MNFLNRSYVQLSSLFVGMLLAAALPVSAGVLTGVIKDDKGKPMEGVMIRVTDDIRRVSESVYTNSKGVYTLVTSLKGSLKLRARKPYFQDANTRAVIPLTGVSTTNVVMFPMTDERDISESLPAAYHFGSLPFEAGDKKDYNRAEFQKDCASCHQLGNSYTRLPTRTPESWEATIQGVHSMMGDFDAELRRQRAVILSKGFDGKPLKVRPNFPLDPVLSNTKIYEYMLERAIVPHDPYGHPTNGLLYTVDEGLNHMVVTDQSTGQSQYVTQSNELVRESRKSFTEEQKQINPGENHGPHSLDLRAQDGKFYVTNAGSRSIGVFNPATNAWEQPHVIPTEMGGFYPHTIRVDKKGVAWFTLGASEHVGRLDPQTGKFNILPLPPAVAGGIYGGTFPYGMDINPIDGAMWYVRFFGDKIGTVNPETLEITEYDSPVLSPRRMRFDKNGILWVAGYSEAKLLRIDVSKGFDTKIYDMPVFAPGYGPAPYAIGVHPDTQDIWVNENLTDRAYRFIPSEERWVVYPLPLSGTFTRDTTFTADGQVCLSNNPVPAPALEGGVMEIICIDPNYDPKIPIASPALSQK